MVRRFTILALFLSLLLQSLAGPLVRIEHGKADGCACRPRESQSEECCCCRKHPAPQPPRDEEQCPCPKGCNQCVRVRESDTRTVAVQRAAVKSIRKVAGEPTITSDPAPTTLTAACIVAPTGVWAHAPPAHLITLRTTVIVV